MANRRDALKSDELRDIHQDIVQRTADQARAWGIATPNVDAASEWVAGQMRQVEVSHEEERTADMHRVDFDQDRLQAKAAELTAKSGDRIIATKEAIGEVEIGPDGVRSNIKRKKVRPIDRMRAVIKWLMAMPEWNAKIDTITNTIPAGPQRDEALKRLIVQATKLYGNYDKLMASGLRKWLK